MLTRYKVAQLDINGCDAIEEDANGEYVEWKDLLPVLREAREYVQELRERIVKYDEYDRIMQTEFDLDHKLKAFLDATKGVEG